MALSVKDFYRFDDFELQPSQRRLMRDGVRIAVTPKGYEVLLCLVERAGRVVAKDELLKAVWPESFVEESNLTQHVFSLRKALGDKGDLIATIPGRGYQFTGKVQLVAEAELTGESSVATEAGFRIVRAVERSTVVVEETTVVPATVPVLRVWWVAGVAAVVVLGLGAWGAWRWHHRVVPGDHHEAVLADFENTTGDPDFDRALKTLLAIDLNQSPFLVVAGDEDTRKVLKLMDRPPDGDLSPAVAREVCQRLNDQVVLSGLIARFGQHYLVTLTANDCANGRDLVRVKAEAGSREDVLKAVDSVADDMRSRLGEPLKSLHPPGRPLEMQPTQSLEALRLYSEAHALQISGNEDKAGPLLERAVQLDPNFAAAYWKLAICYDSLREGPNADKAISKAYELRDQTDEPTKIAIVGLYNEKTTGDLGAVLQDYQDWTVEYPQQPEAWANLSRIELELRKTDAAVRSAERARQIAGTKPTYYSGLVKALFADGRVDESLAMGREAIAKKGDTISMRYWMLNIALMRGDAAGIAEQDAWGAGGGAQSAFEWVEAYALLGQGKVAAAVQQFHHCVQLYRAKGQGQSADGFERDFAYQLMLLGMPEEAGRQIEASAVDVTSQPYITYQAMTGKVAEAEAEVEGVSAKNPKDTLLQQAGLPEMRAVIALERHKPGVAIAALAQANRGALGPGRIEVAYWKGVALLENGQPDLAADAFRYSARATTMNFYDLMIPLSHLGLARALEKQGDHAGARKEYEAMFAIWKDADAGLPPLKQARAEYGKIAASK